MSLSVQQLLNDAKRLTLRLRDHDDSANRVVSNAQETLKAVAEMKQYQEDIETLNAIAHNRPRTQLVLGKKKLYFLMLQPPFTLLATCKVGSKCLNLDRNDNTSKFPSFFRLPKALSPPVFPIHDTGRKRQRYHPLVTAAVPGDSILGSIVLIGGEPLP